MTGRPVDGPASDHQLAVALQDRVRRHAERLSAVHELRLFRLLTTAPTHHAHRPVRTVRRGLHRVSARGLYRLVIVVACVRLEVEIVLAVRRQGRCGWVTAGAQLTPPASQDPRQPPRVPEPRRAFGQVPLKPAQRGFSHFGDPRSA